MNSKRKINVGRILGVIGSLFFAWVLFTLSYYVVTGSGPAHMAPRIAVASFLCLTFWAFSIGIALALTKADKAAEEAKRKENPQS